LAALIVLTLATAGCFATKDMRSSGLSGEDDFYNVFFANKCDLAAKKSEYATAGKDPYNYHATREARTVWGQAAGRGEVTVVVAGNSPHDLYWYEVAFVSEGKSPAKEYSFLLPMPAKKQLMYLLAEQLVPEWPQREARAWIDGALARAEKNSKFQRVSRVVLAKGDRYAIAGYMDNGTEVRWSLRIDRKQANIDYSQWPGEVIIER